MGDFHPIGLPVRSPEAPSGGGLGFSVKHGRINSRVEILEDEVFPPLRPRGWWIRPDSMSICQLTW